MLAVSQATPGQPRRTGMEILITLVAILTPWLVLDIVAGRYGADSRDSLPDDHRR